MVTVVVVLVSCELLVSPSVPTQYPHTKVESKGVALRFTTVPAGTVRVGGAAVEPSDVPCSITEHQLR
jgi:hypothetical protein